MGAKIVSKFLEVGGERYELEPSLAEKYPRYAKRPVEDVEIQIIDMGIEDEITSKILELLIRDFGLTYSDQIYAIRLRDEDYKEEAIKIAMNDYPNLGKYYDMFVSTLLRYLGPGRGAQRYRPLAVYFTTRSDAFRMLLNYFNEDIDQDIVNEGHQGETIRLITVLSAGGGFGSGSLITAHTLLATLLRSRGITFNSKVILNLPIGQETYIPGPADQAPIDGLDGTMASSAALLLELLYLHSMRPTCNLDYVDNIVRIAGRNVGLNISRFIGVDEIIITSFASIGGGNLNDIYDLHDEEIGRFLYPEISAELGTLRENLAAHYNEYMYYIKGLPIEFAKELLIPVTVVGVTSIQINPKKTSSLVEKIIETTRTLEKVRASLSEMIKKRDQLSEELKITTEKLRSLERDYQDIKLDNVGKLIDVVQKLNEINKVQSLILNNIASLNRRIDQIRATSDFNVTEQYITGFQNYFVDFVNSKDLLNFEHELNNSAENAKDLLGKRSLSKDEVISLAKLIILIDSYTNVFQILSKSLTDLINVISSYRKNIEPGIVDKITNRAKCRAYHRLEEIIKIIAEKRDNIYNHVTFHRENLEFIKNEYNMQLKKLEDEINNIISKIKDLNKEIENTNQIIQSLILQEDALKEMLQKLYGDLSKELLRDLQKYYGNILREIRLDEFIKVLSGSDISNIGINLIIDAIRSINNTLAENIIASMVRYMNNLNYFANIAPGDNLALARIVGIKENIELINKCLSETIYIVVSPDNEKLANEIVKRLGRNINIFRINNAKTSFITYIRRRIVTPIQIKEVRESLKKFFELVIRTTDKGRINEYRGLAYLTLDINNKEFMDYLENIKRSLEKFEEEYNKLIQRAPRFQ